MKQLYISERKGNVYSVELSDPPNIGQLETEYRRELEAVEKLCKASCHACSWIIDNSGTCRRNAGPSEDCPELEFEPDTGCAKGARALVDFRLQCLHKSEDFAECFEGPKRAKWKFPLRGVAQSSCVYGYW